MYSSGSKTNGSQFLITYKAIPEFDKKNSVFGYVVEGKEVVDGFKNFKRIEISDCGLII